MTSITLRSWRVLGSALLLMLSGCTATIAEPAFAQVEYVPDGIYTYPSTTYQGRVVYLVDGRWYYQQGPTWMYFYREPEPLRRYRVDHYRAPRVHPQPRQRYVAPPAQRYVAPPAQRYVAPPAQRYVAPPAHRYVAPPAHPSRPRREPQRPAAAPRRTDHEHKR